MLNKRQPQEIDYAIAAFQYIHFHLEIIPSSCHRLVKSIFHVHALLTSTFTRLLDKYTFGDYENKQAYCSSL